MNAISNAASLSGQTTLAAEVSTPTLPATIPATMPAIMQLEYGSADTFELDEVAVPSVSGTDVLVSVHAAGLHRGTWHLMEGLPLMVRALGYGLRAPKFPTPGDELAGVVVATGPDVKRFAVGDAVFGVGTGALAAYAVVPEAKLVTKPRDLTFEQAASLPISAATALQAVVDVGEVKSGQRVLIIGASGGVGVYAVQVAKSIGAHVTGVCSEAKSAFVRSLGADVLIDYRTTEVTDLDTEFDVILDIGGNRSTAKLRSILAPSGTLVFVGGEEGGRWFGGIGRQIAAIMQSAFVQQSMRMFICQPDGDELQRVKDHVESNAIAPVVDKVYPLAESADAMRYMVDGQVKGKLVISMR